MFKVESELSDLLTRVGNADAADAHQKNLICRIETFLTKVFDLPLTEHKWEDKKTLKKIKSMLPSLTDRPVFVDVADKTIDVVDVYNSVEDGDNESIVVEGAGTSEILTGCVTDEATGLEECVGGEGGRIADSQVQDDGQVSGRFALSSRGLFHDKYSVFFYPYFTLPHDVLVYSVYVTNKDQTKPKTFRLINGKVYREFKSVAPHKQNLNTVKFNPPLLFKKGTDIVLKCDVKIEGMAVITLKYV
jgi:hypothetical protein